MNILDRRFVIFALRSCNPGPDTNVTPEIFGAANGLIIS